MVHKSTEKYDFFSTSHRKKYNIPLRLSFFKVDENITEQQSMTKFSWCHSETCIHQGCIQKPVKHLRWSVLREQLTGKNHYFLTPNVPS